MPLLTAFASDPTMVFYSVGSSAADLKTGNPTFSISTGIASFSPAQTGNIGVGDKIAYGTGQTAFIAGRISQSQWRLTDRLGVPLPDMPVTPVSSIRRAFPTLNQAIAGGRGAGFLGSGNLIALNRVLNLALYNDGPADTAAVNVDGYQTDATHYLKVFTPTGGSQSNVSQRHNGTWSSAGYRLEISGNQWPFSINDNYVRLEGLQLKSSTGRETLRSYVSGEKQISHSIIWSTDFDAVGLRSNAQTLKIWNSVIISQASGYQMEALHSEIQGGIIYSYNNTIYAPAANGIKVNRLGSSVYVKNNIVKAAWAIDDPAGTMEVNYTATSDGTADDFGGTGNLPSQTFAFVNTGTFDLHLKASDVTLNQGIDLAADPTIAFSDDIEGIVRPQAAAWDMGAFEYASGGGTLSVSIVNSQGAPVENPLVPFSLASFSFEKQNSAGLLGSENQIIRVANTTDVPSWTLSLAATGGTGALWQGASYTYDFNDLDAAGADDADPDSAGGQLRVDPGIATLVASESCASVTGLSRGSAQTFRELFPAIASITLLSANGGAKTNCSWDILGVSLNQLLPPAQKPDTYHLSFTLTIL